MVESERFSKQMEFIVEIDRLKQIERQSALCDGTRQENVTEHSWHISLMAMLLSEYANDIDIDLLKVIKMLLIHDLVEVYAGDTFAYDLVGNQHKEKREREAAKRIFGILPDDQKEELYSLWEEFESMTTPEAQFASALDKLQPLILSHNNKGWSWKKHGVVSSQIIDGKRDISKGSYDLWEYAMTLIQKSIDAGFLVEG